jgi:hypothetical protein
MRISVFGGSQAVEGTPAYTEATWLGKTLAEQGHTVLTGGYAGTMEAVSRGAAGAGGHVVGVTCAEIETWHKRTANRWVAEERKTRTLVERLQSLIEGCDAAMALPGGPGTLTEISLTWNLMFVGGLKPRPLILIGPAWRTVLAEFFVQSGEYTTPGQRGLLLFASDAASAVRILSEKS